MDNSVVVSIICLAYNHEKYIRKTLEGFIRQKTSFKFEVLINDDASTDNTAAIIRQYEEKYPDIIKATYQKENQYSKGKKITKTFLLPRARGKYLAWCEGDDYWCDELKLQTQYQIMESNSNCHLCVHKTRVVNESGNNLEKFIPAYFVEEGIINNDYFMEIFQKGYPFHTSSYMVRFEDANMYYNNPPEFVKECNVGDIPMMLFYSTLGKVFYIDKPMSCYRSFSNDGWSSKMRKSETQRIKHSRNMIKTIDLYDEYSKGKSHDVCIHLKAKYLSMVCSISNDSNDFREILTKDYRFLLKDYSFKEKMYILLMAYFPILAKLFKIKRES